MSLGCSLGAGVELTAPPATHTSRVLLACHFIVVRNKGLKGYSGFIFVDCNNMLTVDYTTCMCH